MTSRDVGTLVDQTEKWRKEIAKGERLKTEAKFKALFKGLHRMFSK